jgi:multidrug efflux pump subunit AcrA (membrane-fusion protein)
LTAEVWFEWGGESGAQSYLIPASAMAPADNAGQAYVFVYHPESETVKKTLVSVKDIRANSVEVTAGLQPGDIIATAGVHFLTDGQSVTLYKGH